ncbi:hypothetical protein BDV32DRAFT_126625 [Aspergillus pseudonomiae]|nr:hypothetical protein BDV32DRAFT_126625 [Aspergillus pseudonomiae]
MSALYKLAAVNNGPETSWDDNHMRLLARLTDEDIEILQLPSPKCSAKRISAELCQTPAQKDRVMSPPWRLGICAMEDKALSKANQEIFRRLQIDGLIEVVLFGDKTLLSKKPEEWPICDFLIAFYSDGFPLEKVISYTRLRSPFCYNDLLMQGVLFDRRLCNRVLDHLGVRTPKRLEVNRDGGPRAHDWGLVQHVYDRIGLGIPGPAEGEAARERSHAPSVSLSDDGNTLLVDGRTLHKPFVEKPVSAEDHNIYIYFPTTSQGTGGGRRLFRKVGNKCSEYDPDLVVPRCITEQGTTSSYVYEPLLNADNGEDVKAYAVGPQYCFAVTRKSPAVTGVVHRDASGKEVRLPTEVSKEEADAATKISTGFGQSVCGFDIVRNKGKSYVIDVNGWTSVKNQPSFYGQCADILQQMLMSRVAHGIAKN